MFIAGHARLPHGIAAQNVFETLTITAENRQSGGMNDGNCRKTESKI